MLRDDSIIMKTQEKTDCVRERVGVKCEKNEPNKINQKEREKKERKVFD